MNTEITISVPESIASNLAVNEADLSKLALEALAIEGYRDGHLSIGQLAEMLGLSVLQAEEFLSGKGISLNYQREDFLEDLATIEKLDRE